MSRPANAGTPTDRLAEGKLGADLGDNEAAALAFSEVAADASAGTRADALARLGAVRRFEGDQEGAIEALEEAWPSALAVRDSETPKLVSRQSRNRSQTRSGGGRSGRVWR